MATSFNLIGIGEVLWDLLPAGPQLGGAPANFAYHARQFGAEARVITRVGNDEPGQRVLRRFVEMDIHTGTVQVDPRFPTGTANVVLGTNGTPQFTINDSSAAWDSLALTGEALDAVRNASAVCFGTLAQRTGAAASVIRRLVMATSDSALRVFDVNLRQGFYNQETIEQSLAVANVLKLNDHELEVLSAILGLAGSTRQKIEQLARKFNLRLVALTRAEHGSLLFQSGSWSDWPGLKLDVADTVGAGDAFAAALVMGLLNKLALEDIHRIAAIVASFVCSRPGATPILPPHLSDSFALNCASA